MPGGTAIDIHRLMRLAREAWRWWRDGILALLPAGLATAARRLDHLLLVAARDGNLGLAHVTERGRRELGEVTLDGLDDRTAGLELRATVEAAEGSFDRVVLALDPARVLRRRLRLPMAARDTLVESVGYDLDRRTPFRADQVYYGVVPLGVDAAAGEIEVELELVRREDAGRLVAVLRAAGLEVDRIETRPDGPDLLPAGERAVPGLLYPRLTALAGGLVLVLAWAAWWLPLSRVEAEAAATRQLERVARAEALEVDRLREEVARIANRQADLFRRKGGEPMLIGLLAEVTQALPDTAFLIEFGYDGREVTLSGYADRASNAIGWIEGAEHLSGARFLAPVTQDQRIGRERFTLAAGLRSVATESTP